ncbi:MAG: DEAD/DEAH box helicase [Candidatus Cloacimonetes bacterium]|nr:DEAD/DEAH box helicase [Candidatus Cloacimonadota bacterium]
MARLFGAEYHEHSNTWYYRSNVKPLDRGALTYTRFRDQNGRDIITFAATKGYQSSLPGHVVVIYNPQTHIIESHHCESCSEDVCSHFLTVVQYAYQFLSTDDIDGNAVQTFQTNLLQVNEFWQRILLNARILVSKLYDTTDRVRIHFRDYDPIDIRVVSLLAAERDPKTDDERLLERAYKQLAAFTDDERQLLVACQNLKCSYSRVNSFFTVYKQDMMHLMPLLRNLAGKVHIEETGELLVFEDEPLRLSFVVRHDEVSGRYMLKLAPGELVSAAFVGVRTYILRRNVVHTVRLPFRPEASDLILREGQPLDPVDMVYGASVVARQLSLIGCYIDFDPGIELPRIFDTNPVVTFHLKREGDSILLEGLLDYESGTLIPMSVIRFPTELVRVDLDGEETWFYIPPQVRYEALRFVDSLPDADMTRLESDSTLVFEGEQTIDKLKRIIFEDADPAWNIVLSEELKREFVYKVALQPQLSTRSTDQIDWFEYEVNYQYQDRSFSHAQLRRFFRSKEKFLKLEDGRLLYFTNREAYDEVEDIMKRSRKVDDESYHLEVYNIPFLYQLANLREGLKVKGDAYLQQMYSAILARQLPVEHPIPASLRAIMRSYQKRGFAWLKMLQRYRLAGILADDMGLGKTLEAISILADLPTGSHSLVVCPKSLLYNWAAEIDKFYPSLSHLIYEGGKEERMELLRQPRVNVMIASYAIIVNDLKELGELAFDYVILDEAQQIKNAGAQRSKAVKRMHGAHRIALTGTPMENSPGELWSIFDFLMPGYLPSQRRFRNEFDTTESQREKHNRLAAIISPFLLRRRKKDVLIELPDKQIQVSYCHLTPLQEKLYIEVIESVRTGLLGDSDRIEPSKYMHVLAALMRLRQICNHPALVQKDLHQRIDMSGKLDQLVTLLDDALPLGRKVLIFSQFVQTLKIVRRILEGRNVPFEYMDGDTKHRQKRVDNFNNNVNIRVFLISLKTGGFGLNLTAADTVIMLDPWWNPMGENQAIDRAHRIGQTKKVQVYKMITKGTVEEKILDLQKSKIEMFENIIEGGSNILSKLDTEELRELFEYTT